MRVGECTVGMANMGLASSMGRHLGSGGSAWSFRSGGGGESGRSQSTVSAKYSGDLDIALCHIYQCCFYNTAATPVQARRRRDAASSNRPEVHRDGVSMSECFDTSSSIPIPKRCVSPIPATARDHSGRLATLGALESSVDHLLQVSLRRGPGT